MSAPHEAEFCDFVNGRGAALMRMAFLLTADHGLAEDAVQATLAKLYVAWPRIRRRDAVEAYARRVLAREVLSWHRKRQPVHVLSADVGDRAIPAGTDSIDERDRMQRALQLLSPAQRAVVVLRYYEDLSVEQTADVLGIARGTVKAHVARGLATLRRELDEAASTTDGDVP